VKRASAGLSQILSSLPRTKDALVILALNSLSTEQSLDRYEARHVKLSMTAALFTHVCTAGGGG